MAAAKEKSSGYIAKEEFRDINDFNKVFAKGDEIPGDFAEARIKDLEEKGIIEKEKK